MLRIECDPPEQPRVSPDCSTQGTTLLREVFDDDEQIAIFVARFNQHDNTPSANTEVIFLDVVFALELRRNEAGNICASFIDADGDIGEARGLTSAQALAHPRMLDALDVLDCVIRADTVLNRQFERAGVDV